MERGPQAQTAEALEEQRLLSEVDHLQAHLRIDGTVSADIAADITTNLQTAVYEIAMPSAVSITYQKVVYHETEQGNRIRSINWLGKNAVAMALDGKQYYQSSAAHQRVDIEVAEARHAEDHLTAGVAQVFISPKMSTTDATLAVAKAEHLDSDDSVRVSYAITNHTGEVIGRELRSLLVRDIPLAAWVSLLRDPDNLFGQAFMVPNADSALSVMELFQELTIPEAALPEGPVNLVAAVIPYIRDEQTQASVTHQLDRFRADQQHYQVQAEKTAQQWFTFDLALAQSLANGTANVSVRQFMASMQHVWNDADRDTINNHSLADGEYVMTRQLAAIMERGKREVLNKIAAVVTGNEQVLADLDQQIATSITTAAAYSDIAGSYQATLRTQADLERQVATIQMKIGGGCPGDIATAFQIADQVQGENTRGSQPDRQGWKWKSGVCRVKGCPSPRPTPVGPCEVCLHCQSQFDAGKDPSKVYYTRPKVQRVTRRLLQTAA